MINNSSIKISVIVPTYQPGDYLWECLVSLAEQSFPHENFEVVLVLNGCREPWKSQIEQFISDRMSGINVNFVQTDVGGVSNARNIGIDISKGDYITFLDDDDYLSDSYLQRLYEKSAVNTVVLSNALAFNDGSKEEKVKYQLTDVYKKFAHKKHLSLSSKVRKYFNGPVMKLFPMTIIRDRRFDTRFKNGEDSLYMFLISDAISNIAFASSDAIYYRRYRPNSAITRKRTRRERIINTLKGIHQYCRIYNVCHYNFLFFLSRVLAEIKFLIKTILQG